MASDTVDTVVPQNPPSAGQRPKRRQGGPGVPFTSETAKKAQLSAAKAKKIRRQVRAQMLNTLVTKSDLGEELVIAVHARDMNHMNVLKTAIELVGLSFNQSSESVQNVKLDAKTDSTVKTKIVLEDMTEADREE